MALPQTAFSPITLAECLRIEPFTAARVVAGAAGLDRPVRWVHPVDVPNIKECLVGGELVMTSGISLGHDLGLQRRIVPVMAEMDLAGLVVAVGPYLDRVPGLIVAAADDHDIPVLELPWEVNFRDVTEAILTAIVDRQHAMLQLSAEVHRGLTRLVLQGGGLQDLTDRLATLLGRSALVFDPAFHLLAGTAAPAAGGLVRATLAAKRAPAAAIERVRRFDSERRPPDGQPRVFSETDLDGLLAPIVVERRAHGHLWVDGGGRPFGALDVIAAEHGATIAALVTYKDNAVRRAERRQERDLFDLLLDGVPVGGDLQEAEGFLPPEGDVLVLVVESGERDPALTEKVAERALAEVAPHARARWRGRHLVLILPAADGAAAVERLQEVLAEGGAPPRIGVSMPAARPGEVGAAYRAAREALRLVPLVDGDRRVCRAEEIRTLRRLAEAAAGGGGEPLRVARLAAHDAAHGARLLETLDRYLQHDGNVSVTARSLGVHRHTLLNRMARIADVLDMELTPAARLELRLQLVLHHLGCESGPA